MMIHQRLPGLRVLSDYLRLAAGPRDFEHCIAYAVQLFHKYFRSVGVCVFSRRCCAIAIVVGSLLSRLTSAVLAVVSATCLVCSLLIQHLVANLPADKLTKDGKPFWSGSKRMPTPAVLDLDNPLHAAFVIATANLLAASLDLKATDVSRTLSWGVYSGVFLMGCR